jgi:hypothetical protein
MCQHMPCKEHESRSKRHQRDRASAVRAEIIDDWLAIEVATCSRVAQVRIIHTPVGEKTRLMAWARQLPAQAHRQIVLRGRDGAPGPRVELRVTWRERTICPPRAKE